MTEHEAKWQEFNDLRHGASLLLRITGYLFLLIAVAGGIYVIGEARGYWLFHPLILALIVVVILVIVAALTGIAVRLNEKAWRLLLELYRIKMKRTP